MNEIIIHRQAVLYLRRLFSNRLHNFNYYNNNRAEILAQKKKRREARTD